MNLCVIGCGYVGLVTGACLAEAGHDVICTDVDRARIAQLNAGEVPIYEHHLDDVLEICACNAGKISYTDDAGDAIRRSEAIFICVGTPPKENGEADLSAIDNVARQIATEARSSKLVIEKSTVPARTGLELRRALNAYSRNSAVTFRVVSNPEFLREGTAVEDFLPPRSHRRRSRRRNIRRADARNLSPDPRAKILVPGPQRMVAPRQPTSRLLVTTINSAELIKHASNSFLALKISYANVLADLCEKIGADVNEVTHAMGLDSRIGGQFLKAGLGFGGFCFPKDLQAFVHLAGTVGVDFDILKAAERVNKQRIDRFLEKVHQALWVIKGKRVALLGLAFKANTDDTRFSPALDVAQRLVNEGADVHATDPEAVSRAKAVLPQVTYHEDVYDTLRDAEAALICTDWDEFRNIDWEKAGSLMARRLVIDGRGLCASATHARTRLRIFLIRP